MDLAKLWKGTRICVTGGAGFIGSQLVRTLVTLGAYVLVIDDFSTGRIEHLEEVPCEMEAWNIRTNYMRIMPRLKGYDAVFHLAAKADVRGGVDSPMKDLENVETTVLMLEACARAGVKEFYLASSATVYGPGTHDESSDLNPISHYAASKAACEAYALAYADLHNMKVCIFRIANVVGPRVTHGVILDFIHALRKDPKHLYIKGSGAQLKPYIHVHDCVSRMLEWRGARMPAVNLTANTFATVETIAGIIADEMHVMPELHTEAQGAGWLGDVTLSCINSRFAWSMPLAYETSEVAIRAAVKELLQEIK